MLFEWDSECLYFCACVCVSERQKLVYLVSKFCVFLCVCVCKCERNILTSLIKPFLVSSCCSDGKPDGRVADLGWSRDRRSPAASRKPPPRHDPQDLRPQKGWRHFRRRRRDPIMVRFCEIFTGVQSCKTYWRGMLEKVRLGEVSFSSFFKITF